ncbi:hypothetical protein [Mycobacterium kyorinense]|uniref:hypothetical protein n=1 Tax=Mycobacterium kyorinense TaxID=487514 RepID=UPI000A969573|nr:hypothetical protein [Mycobacterium kyorinense]
MRSTIGAAAQQPPCVSAAVAGAIAISDHVNTEVAMAIVASDRARIKPITGMLGG